MQALRVTIPKPLRLLEAAVLEREVAVGVLEVTAEEDLSAAWVILAVAGVPEERFEAEAVETVIKLWEVV